MQVKKDAWDHLVTFVLWNKVEEKKKIGIVTLKMSFYAIV